MIPYTVTPADEGRNLVLLASAAAERAMREQEPAANPPPLASIALARVRIETKKFNANWGRRRGRSTTDYTPPQAVA